MRAPSGGARTPSELGVAAGRTKQLAAAIHADTGVPGERRALALLCGPSRGDRARRRPVFPGLGQVEIVDEVDVVCKFNGASFFLYHGLSPLNIVGVQRDDQRTTPKTLTI